MTYEAISDRINEQARDLGAEYPSIIESTDGDPIVVDESSGRTWKVTLVEF